MKGFLHVFNASDVSDSPSSYRTRVILEELCQPLGVKPDTLSILQEAQRLVCPVPVCAYLSAEEIRSYRSQSQNLYAYEIDPLAAKLAALIRARRSGTEPMPWLVY